MMLPLLLALQLAAAPAGADFIVLRNASTFRRVPLVTGAAGPLLKPEQLAPFLAVAVTRTAPGRFRVTVGGTAMTLETGVAAVSVAGQVRQLASPPVERNRQLYVPLQIVSEILPEFVSNVRWDAPNRQLVLFSRVERATARDPARDGAAGASSRGRPATREEERARRTVVVDAGHGGPDNGMTGPYNQTPSLVEKQVTLEVAKRLGRELERRGLRVIYTRRTDTLIALSDRGRIANQAGGDLFISIHVNAANPGWRDPGAARGFETYFLAEAKTEDARRVEQMENESVRFETGPRVGKDDALSFILSDMKQNEHLRESSELAEIVQERLAATHPGPNRGVKQAGFRVLVTAFMPAVLVEIGFGTNAQEAAYLNDPARQTTIATSIADAAVEYLRRYERRVHGGSGP
jgi:N-acetylmuramoyl-L-alanine amidase